MPRSRRPRRRAPALPARFDPDAAGDGRGLYGLPFSPDEARVVIVPVPFEATTSYGAGTANGPAAVLRASQQVDLHDPQTRDPFRAGIAMEPVAARVRAWNREARRLALPILRRGGRIDGDPRLARARQRVNEIGARLNDWVHERVASRLASGQVPGVLGGDHSVAFGAIRAAAAAHPGLGILHVDAHADLREAYEGFTWSHASIMGNVVSRLPEVKRVVQVGLRDVALGEQRRIRGSRGRIRAWHDADLARDLARGKRFAAIARTIVAGLPRRVWVSFDVDGLDPALCPGTGTPVPGGLTWHQSVSLLETLCRSGRRIVGFDLCEVAPSPGGGEWDANVGARLLYKLIGFTLLSQRSR
jgi:agmatinase